MSVERLSRSQMAVKALTDRALAERHTTRLTFVDFAVTATPSVVEAQLRTMFPDLMLRDGESLSAAGGGDYYPELNLFIGKARLASVGLRVFGWEYPKYRIDPKGPTTPPYDVITFPGEKDWARSIEVRLWYTDGKEWACQTVSLHTSSIDPGAAPSVTRDVSAPSYAETGYEGHNQKGRACTAREAARLIRLATDLFEHRVGAPGVAGLG